MSNSNLQIVSFGANHWVAELSSSLRAQGNPSDRYSVDKLGIDGVSGGYWSTSEIPDELGTMRPEGIKILVRIEADDPRAAEDIAIEAGARITDVIGFYAGSVAAPAYLQRLAQVTQSGHLISQRDYIYFPEHLRFDRSNLRPRDVRRIMDRVAIVPSDTLDLVRRALRWYSKALSAQEFEDKFLAAWIGFETIGPLLFGMFSLSKNGRKRFEASIEHMLHSVEAECIEQLGLDGLTDLRGQITHGGHSRKGVKLTPRQIRHAAVELESALGSGILSILARGIEDPQGRIKSESYGTWSVYLPPDQQIRPDMMLGVEFSESLPGVKPFFGEWADLKGSVRTQSSSSFLPLNRC